jgi:hypothetical protein
MVVADTLELLIQKNSIKKTKELAIEIANAFNKDENGAKQFEKRILQVVSFLRESYGSAKKLIDLIRNGKEPIKRLHKRMV